MNNRLKPGLLEPVSEVGVRVRGGMSTIGDTLDKSLGFAQGMGRPALLIGWCFPVP